MIGAWPQWVMASILFYSLGSMLFKDGKKGDATSAFFSVAAGAMFFVVLYFGGFWAPLGFAP